MRRFADVAERAILAVESQQWLDIPSYKVEHGLALTLNLLGAATEPVRNLLHGTWLGHPVHPPLTDLPLGAWTAALVLDAVDARSSRPAAFGDAARLSIGVGLVGAAGAAVTGLADWQYTHDDARRTGLVHGVLNGVAVGLYTASWLDRRRGRHRRARWVAGIGYAVVQAGAYLGGSLVSRHRVGVDHADRSIEPRSFVAVLPDAELPEGQLRLVQAGGVAAVLVRSDGAVHAFGEHCPHLGGPLAEGWIYQGGIVCPWHGSRFDLATGRLVSGPATAPLPCFQSRVRNGQIELRRRPPVPSAPPGSVVAREQERADAGH